MVVRVGVSFRRGSVLFCFFRVMILVCRVSVFFSNGVFNFVWKVNGEDTLGLESY